ncbi:MAG: PKD domain-containing protein [Candidatus Nanoarchaeia archaeon]
MKRGRILLVFVIVFSIFFVNLIVAGFQVGNPSHNIQEYYGPRDNIKGWINISLTNEPTNSVFEDNNGNSISLIDLLNTDSNYIHNCVPTDCESGFTMISGSGEIEKTFSESKLIGFNFDEDLNGIDSIKFMVDSDASPSCFNQLEIDFFNDGTIDTGNDKIFSGQDCGFLRNFGCFNSSVGVNEYGIGTITGNKHCQKVTLGESPGFKIGAWVKNESGYRDLTAALHKLNGEEIATCDLPNNPSDSGEEISCNVNYAVTKPGDFFVCIYSNEGSGEYKLQGYNANSINQTSCAGFSSDVEEGNFAYRIFAEGRRFNVPGTLNISDPDNLGNRAKEYLLNKAGNLNCASQGCVVPIKFILSGAQIVTIRDLRIDYSTSGGGLTSNTFYEINETPAIVSAGFQKLSLDNGNFSVPNNFGNYDFELELDGNPIFNRAVIVENIPVINGLSPLTTIAAIPTTFNVNINLISTRNYTFEWTFGDGTKNKTTSIENVTHTYNSTGIYNLRVVVTDNSQRTSNREFIITVNSPQDFANETLKEYQEDLDNVKTQLKEFPEFEQNSLITILNTDEIEDELRDLQRSFSQALSVEDYIAITKRLLGLRVPESVATTNTANEILFPLDVSKVDLNILALISDGEYAASDEEQYLNAIFNWNQKNLETRVSFNEISSTYDNFEEPSLRTFKIKIKENPDVGVGENSFFILRKLENLNFKENYLEQETSGFVYIEIAREEKTIEFSTTEEIDFQSLPAFISPNINELSITGEINPSVISGFRWGLFFLIVFFLIIIGIVVYLILYQWYKNKYENYLFKNKNNLYNLFHYIETSKRRGMTNKEIISKLRKAGWNSEQIRYAMRKYLGKKTGMFEIPLGKVLKNLRIKNLKKSSYPRQSPLGRDLFKRDLRKRKDIERKFYRR